MTDTNEITHALCLWFHAGDVFEVRVLDAVSDHLDAAYLICSGSGPIPDCSLFFLLSTKN